MNEEDTDELVSKRSLLSSLRTETTEAAVHQRLLLDRINHTLNLKQRPLFDGPASTTAAGQKTSPRSSKTSAKKKKSNRVRWSQIPKQQSISMAMEKSIEKTELTAKRQSLQLLQESDEIVWQCPETLFNMRDESSYKDAMDLLVETGVVDRKVQTSEREALIRLLEKRSPQKGKRHGNQGNRIGRGRKSSQISSPTSLVAKLKTSMLQMDGFWSAKEAYDAQLAQNPPPMMSDTVRKFLPLHERLMEYKDRKEKSLKWLRRRNLEQQQSAGGTLFSSFTTSTERSVQASQSEYNAGARNKFTKDIDHINAWLNPNLNASFFDLELWLNSSERKHLYIEYDNIVPTVDNRTPPAERINLSNLNHRDVLESIDLLDASVQKIDFEGSQLLSKGIERLGGRLADCVNIKLQELSLCKTDLDDTHVVRLASSLEENYVLKRLSLAQNTISSHGAQAIANMLKTNFSLIELELGGNMLRNQGLVYLGSGLKDNSTLMYLGISSNLIGRQENEQDDEGFAAVHQFSTLIHRSGLVHIDLANNGLGLRACQLLCSVVNRKGTSLQGLHLEGNRECEVQAGVDGSLRCEVATEKTSIKAVYKPFSSFLDQPPPLHTRFSTLSQQVNCSRGGCTCWICDGWSYHRFVVSAPGPLRATNKQERENDLTKEQTKEMDHRKEEDNSSTCVVLRLWNNPDQAIPMEYDDAKQHWSATVLVPPGILWFWFSRVYQDPVEQENDEEIERIESSEYPITDQGLHILRLPVRSGKLIPPSQSRELEWTIVHSVFAGEECQGLWNVPRPKVTDDIIEIQVVEEYLVAKGRLEGRNSLFALVERDWQSLLKNPVLVEHFGAHRLPFDKLKGIDLSPDFEFAGSKDTLEAFHKAFIAVYPALSSIWCQLEVSLPSLHSALEQQGFHLREEIDHMFWKKQNSFLHFVMCCVKEQYEQDVELCDDSIELGLGASLDRFVNVVLKPSVNFSFLEPDRFRREQLYHSSVDILFRESLPSLKRLYQAYCKNPSGGITCDEWTKMLADVRAFNSCCTPEKASLAFSQALPLRALCCEERRGSTDQVARVKFPRFLESLARVAAYGIVVPTRVHLEFLRVNTVAEFYARLSLIESCVHPQLDLWCLFARPPSGGVQDLSDRVSALLELIAADWKVLEKRNLQELQSVKVDSAGSGTSIPEHLAAIAIDSFFAMQKREGRKHF